jgi:hypothetical protein
MHNDNSTSVAETTARLEREEAKQDANMQGTTLKSVESVASTAAMQNSSSVEEEARESDSEEQTNLSDGRPLFDPKGLYFPTNSHQTDERAKKVLADFQRVQRKSSRTFSAIKSRGFKTHLYSSMI